MILPDPSVVIRVATPALAWVDSLGQPSGSLSSRQCPTRILGHCNPNPHP